MPYLDTTSYQKNRSKYANLHLLDTCSELEESNEKVQVKVRDEEPLVNIRGQHRRAINELAELNGQIVRNLAAKLQAVSNKKLKETGVL